MKIDKKASNKGSIELKAREQPDRQGLMECQQDRPQGFQWGISENRNHNREGITAYSGHAEIDNS